MNSFRALDLRLGCRVPVLRARSSCSNTCRGAEKLESLLLSARLCLEWFPYASLVHLRQIEPGVAVASVAQAELGDLN